MCEVFWTYSVKFMTFKDLKLLRFDNFYLKDKGLPILLPFLGYIVFGIGNIVCFSATKKTPFFTYYGFNLELDPNVGDDVSKEEAPVVEERLKLLRDVQEEIKKNL